MSARLIGPFASGVKATAYYKGRRFIQIEGERENLFTYSRQIDHTDWIKNNLHATTPVVANDILAPDGTLTADRLVEDNTPSSTHYIYQSVDVDGTNQYCLSVFVKKHSRQLMLALPASHFVSWPVAIFDPETGSFIYDSGTDDYGVVECAGRWYRCYITGTSDVSGSCDIILMLVDGTIYSYNGDNTSGLYIWNPQVEIGSFPSSPILTTSGAAIRNKDQAYIPDADVPALMRDKFAFQFITPSVASFGQDLFLFDFAASGSSHRIGIYYSYSSDTIRVYDFTDTALLVESSALTLGSRQIITGCVDPTAGSLLISGAATGNGTTVGSSWATTGGAVCIGQDVAYDNHCYGQVSEPYRMAA